MAVRNHHAPIVYHKPILKRKPKVLLVVESSVDARTKDCKVENIIHPVVVGSLEDTNLAEVDLLYWDVYYHNTGRKADDRIVSLIHHNRPDLVVISCSDEGMLDIPKVLVHLQTRSIPVVYLWWDFAGDYIKNLCSRVGHFVTLNVIMDDTVAPQGNYMCMYSSHDTRVFYDSKEKRTIDACFIGTSEVHFQDRLRSFELLKNAGVNLVTGRGLYDRLHDRLDVPLTFKEYAAILQKSKIGLNFTKTGNFYGAVRHQVKGRTFEILRCGAMLLESENEHTPKRLIPDVDYVSFADEKELVHKAIYYLEHEGERVKIAYNGWKKATEQYSNKAFWREIFDKIFSIGHYSE